MFVRLIFNPYVLDYYPRGELRILNWLAYTYLVPAVTMAGMWAVFRRREIERRRSWERPFFPSGHAALANLAATFAIVVLFMWVNLTIVDFFAPTDALELPVDRMPARDVSMSIAWAIFAVGLLALGMWRRSGALRYASLGLILVTCAKVFLYDLAHLEDLFRVASLAGLAVALIVVSLAYKRFVFRSAEPSSREETSS